MKKVDLVVLAVLTHLENFSLFSLASILANEDIMTICLNEPLTKGSLPYLASGEVDTSLMSFTYHSPNEWQICVSMPAKMDRVPDAVDVLYALAEEKFIEEKRQIRKSYLRK